MQNNQIKRNGCFNRKFSMTVVVQDGYKNVLVLDKYGGAHVQTIVPNFIEQPFRMSTDCKYDRKMIDKGCEGCKHQQESK